MSEASERAVASGCAIVKTSNFVMWGLPTSGAGIFPYPLRVL